MAQAAAELGLLLLFFESRGAATSSVAGRFDPVLSPGEQRISRRATVLPACAGRRTWQAMRRRRHN